MTNCEKRCYQLIVAVLAYACNETAHCRCSSIKYFRLKPPVARRDLSLCVVICLYVVHRMCQRCDRTPVHRPAFVCAIFTHVMCSFVLRRQAERWRGRENDGWTTVYFFAGICVGTFTPLMKLNRSGMLYLSSFENACKITQFVACLPNPIRVAVHIYLHRLVCPDVSSDIKLGRRPYANIHYLSSANWNVGELKCLFYSSVS